jgi:hypothetical protein
MFNYSNDVGGFLTRVPDFNKSCHRVIHMNSYPVNGLLAEIPRVHLKCDTTIVGKANMTAPIKPLEGSIVKPEDSK